MLLYPTYVPLAMYALCLFFQFRETILPSKLNAIISHFEKRFDHDNFGNSPKSEVLIEAINPLFQLSDPYDESCDSRCLF